MSSTSSSVRSGGACRYMQSAPVIVASVLRCACCEQSSMKKAAVETIGGPGQWLEYTFKERLISLGLRQFGITNGLDQGMHLQLGRMTKILEGGWSGPTHIS